MKQLIIPAFLLFLFSCGPTAEELAQRQADSIDSVNLAAELVQQKIAADSLHRIDSINQFPCPELKEWIRLNERAVFVIQKAANIPDARKKLEPVVDSISKVQKALMKNTFSDPLCQKRYEALSIKFLNDMDNALLDISPYLHAISREKQSRETDSLVKAILYGK